MRKWFDRNVVYRFGCRCNICGKECVTVETGIIHQLRHHRERRVIAELWKERGFILKKMIIVNVFKMILRLICEVCYWVTWPFMQINEFFDFLGW